MQAVGTIRQGRRSAGIRSACSLFDAGQSNRVNEWLFRTKSFFNELRDFLLYGVENRF